MKNKTLKAAAILGITSVSLSQLSDVDLNNMVEMEPYLNTNKNIDYGLSEDLNIKTQILKEYQQYKKDRKAKGSNFVELEEFRAARELLEKETLVKPTENKKSLQKSKHTLSGYKIKP